MKRKFHNSSRNIALAVSLVLSFCKPSMGMKARPPVPAGGTGGKINFVMDVPYRISVTVDKGEVALSPEMRSQDIKVTIGGGPSGKYTLYIMPRKPVLKSMSNRRQVELEVCLLSGWLFSTKTPFPVSSVKRGTHELLVAIKDPQSSGETLDKIIGEYEGTFTLVAEAE
ncbi:MAG: hypothetical protein LBJ70_05105 [Holosporales bacterium]|jgi:hypothetical protein|nr:hypothetical protein [Holosporales bacterium]